MVGGPQRSTAKAALNKATDTSIAQYADSQLGRLDSQPKLIQMSEPNLTSAAVQNSKSII